MLAESPQMNVGSIYRFHCEDDPGQAEALTLKLSEAINRRDMASATFRYDQSYYVLTGPLAFEYYTLVAALPDPLKDQLHQQLAEKAAFDLTVPVSKPVPLKIDD